MAKTIVMEWQRALYLRDGRVVRVLGPGRHRYRTRRASIVTVDVRPQLLTVPGQDVLTPDGLNVRVSALVRWHIVDPMAYVTAADSVVGELYAAVQLVVRDAIASLTIDEVIARRHQIGGSFTESVQSAVDGFGVEVGKVAVKDLMLPAEIRRALAETVLAREQGKAALERARAESAALRSLANTARLLEDHPALLQLRTLQAASAPGATVVLTPNGQPPTAVAVR